ncbi:hypothetical protein QN277_001679 [Acacia crassicarpa]|uniref:C2H2-type domain-containing protein n=1 Tax=Acacia crassicarpa TaxID=499986 RepID=A0AAE1N7L5_9FABA|nr:hypothetical protein QN277_001679 [Acacia crassicarpa]
MSLSDAGPVPAPSLSTTPSSSPGQKQHCRSKRKKRLGVVIDHKVSFKPKYAKQPHHHPDAAASPMIPRPCTECGKKFWSWKALFGHMRCHPERQWRGINPPPNLQRQPPPPPDNQTPVELLMTAEDHEIAAGLLLLANSEGPVAGGGPSTTRFECSSCKKVFSSRQALGGHRASHKNVKGCFANEEDEEMTSAAMMVLEGHKCGICLRVFSSGQALGGHMRCHWDKGDPEPNLFHHHQGFGLDLNLPPPTLPHDSSSSSPITLDLRLGL